MDVLNLAELLLSPDEKNELHSSMELLEQSDHSAFYEKNQSIIQSILFLETLEEFLDFSKENELDAECFCAAFLCAHGYTGNGISGNFRDCSQRKDIHGLQRL